MACRPLPTVSPAVAALVTLPVSAPLIRTSVYERIRGEILSCALRPGAQLQERDLASRYEVSKSPIRDALLRLQEQNLIEVLPRKGYRVRPVSVADAREMYEMRSMLERSCVARMIESGADDALRGLDAFRLTPTETDLGAWIGYNRRFHLAIAEGSGNSRLARATREIIEQFDRLTYMSVTASEAGSLADFVREHVEIVEAIQQRDKRQAGTLIKDHVESSRKRLLDSLASLEIIP
jgi:GntR family transcriptional regulator, rspAB operon transcriptional repressor